MKVNVSIVNAFTDSGEGGNPAGVVLHADGFDNATKLSIARQVGLSETAFVSRSKIADFKLDFFTPNRQIAHCGHATIAAFSLLAQQGLVPSQKTSKETIDGVRKVSVQQHRAFMEQLKPRYQFVESYTESTLDSLGLSNSDVMGVPCVVNTGNSFLILGVKSRAVLEKIKPNLESIQNISEALDLIGFYLFTMESYREGRDASTRMFAPRFGISEEAATGMAAGPLACYLHDYHNRQQKEFLIEQGYSMGTPSPSVITVKLSIVEGKIQSLTAGGSATVTGLIEVEMQDN